MRRIATGLLPPKTDGLFARKDDAEKAIERDATRRRHGAERQHASLKGVHKAMESYQQILEIDSENADSKEWADELRMINAALARMI